MAQELEFVKGSSFGNDFLILTKESVLFEPKLEFSNLAKYYCDRHSGVGADGLLAFRRAGDDVALTIFNADGSEAAMCGNGLRTFVTWWQSEFKDQNLSKIVTKAGSFDVKWQPDNNLAIGWPRLPVKIDDFTFQGYAISLLDSGVPHALIETNELPNNWEVLSSALVKARDCNVDWVITGQDSFKLYTYERGAGPTLACGTGSVAAAMHLFKARNVLSGILKVHYASGKVASILLEHNKIFLVGPIAKIICRGKLL